MGLVSKRTFSISIIHLIQRIIQPAMENLSKRLYDSDPNLPTLYTGAKQPVDDNREFLGKFKGGSVELSFVDDIAVVSLNHSEKRNAISGKMMGDLLNVVTQLEDWKTGKGVLLWGSGGNFCSGGDLNFARGTGNADDGFRMATFMDNVLSRFQTLPLISVALVEGCGALGGGAELTVACDYRLMASDCKGLGFVHGRMAIVPAWGGTRRLISVVGYRRALEVLTTARVYAPNDALQIGLIDGIVDVGVDAKMFALDWLRERTKLETNVIRGLKITAVLAENGDDSDLENRIFAPFWGSEANKAALAANIKHRPS